MITEGGGGGWAAICWARIVHSNLAGWMRSMRVYGESSARDWGREMLVERGWVAEGEDMDAWERGWWRQWG